MTRLVMASLHALGFLLGAVLMISSAAATDTRSAGQAFSDGLVELDRGDTARGFALLEQAANEGHIDAAHELGRRLVAGDAGRIDIDAGIRWLTKAAGQNRAQAQYDLAVALQGRGAAGDHEQGHAWLGAASRAGHPDATFAIGVKGLFGEAADWNSPATFERLRELQRRNDPKATHLVASALAAGRGAPHDLPEAIRLFERASSLGDRDALAEMRWVLATIPIAERRRLMR